MAKRRFRSKPRKLSGFITGSLHPNVLRRMKVTEIGHHWVEVVGPLLAGKSSVSGLEEDQLVVMASSSSVAQQIKMRAGTIRQRIRDIWNIEVDGIKVYVGSRPKRPDVPHSPGKGPSMSPSSREIMQELDVLEDRLDNPKLARSLARLRAIYRKRFGN